MSPVIEKKTKQNHYTEIDKKSYLKLKLFPQLFKFKLLCLIFKILCYFLKNFETQNFFFILDSVTAIYLEGLSSCHFLLS